MLQGDAGVIENEWKFAAMVLDRVYKYSMQCFFLLQGDAGIIENEWKFAAMVLDRVCLIAFTFFTVEKMSFEKSEISFPI